MGTFKLGGGEEDSCLVEEDGGACGGREGGREALVSGDEGGKGGRESVQSCSLTVPVAILHQLLTKGQGHVEGDQGSRSCHLHLSSSRGKAREDELKIKLT